MLRLLRPGDSIGNTSLIKDHMWEYSAVSAHEDTWTLSIGRSDLTDLLRGRAELAHAVLFGVYYTFSRRLQQVVQQGLSVRSEWLFAADVDKHSSPMRSAQAGPPLSPSHPFCSPPPLGSRNSFDLRFD